MAPRCSVVAGHPRLYASERQDERFKADTAGIVLFVGLRPSFVLFRPVGHDAGTSFEVQPHRFAPLLLVCYNRPRVLGEARLPIASSRSPDAGDVGIVTSMPGATAPTLRDTTRIVPVDP